VLRKRATTPCFAQKACYLESLKAEMLMKPFTSYLSVGVLVTAISALLFTKLNWMAFPFLGLTCGLATQNLRRCLTGLITSAGFALILVVLVPAYTSRPEPPGLLHFGAIYIAAIFGASIGAALQLPQGRLVLVATMSSALSLVALVLLSLQLHAIFPEKLLVLELWEYATILLAVPVLGFGTWWPIDSMKRRQ